jgi:glyoxylase-like metal-dependent hydrolase (beta-lactamase superfamily II)
VVEEHRLKPVSVLVTHGHVDHMFCVAPVAGGYDATAWIHPSDRHLLTDPLAGMSPETARMMLGGDYTWEEPTTSASSPTCRSSSWPASGSSSTTRPATPRAR